MGSFKMRKFLRSVWRSLDKAIEHVGVDVNPGTKQLYKFTSAKDVEKWQVFSDADFGGLSKATLALGEGGKSAVFSGHYNRRIPDSSSLIRSGFCGVRHVRPWDLNLPLHDYLDFRLRGDGHTYLATLRFNSFKDDEAWQAALPTRPDGAWETVRVDFREFIFTYRGRLVADQAAMAGGMPREGILALGVTLPTDGDMPEEGDFRLEVESVTAGAYEVKGAAAERKALEGYLPMADDPMYEAPSKYNRPGPSNPSGSGSSSPSGAKQQ